MSRPDDAAAAAIAERQAGEPITHCVRFPTGLRNWVYDVTTATGRRLVVRMCAPANRAELAGGVRWSQSLAEAGVPVATVLGSDVDAALPFVILERLPGTDLGHVIGDLGSDAIDRITEAVAGAQRRVGRLLAGAGFGYSVDGERGLQPRWVGALDDELQRWIAAIAEAGVVSAAVGERGRAALAGIEPILDAVAPTPYLHDATTKNVIVDGGRLSGIVDIDTMGYGDPLWCVALTRMSLLAAGHETTYADRYAEALGRPDDGRLRIYTALHGIGFLAELGHVHNRGAAAAVDAAHADRLTQLVESLLSR